MNIICETAQGANYFIMKAYVSAFAALGHNVIFWDSSQRSCYDIWYETEKQLGKVDLYFGHTWRLDRAILANLKARPETKTLMRASHNGELDDKIDKEKYPVGIATEEEKSLVKQLKNSHPNFEYVTSQYSQKEMERSQTHNRWEEMGLKTRGILLCADINDYHWEPVHENYKCDVTFVGGYWPYKSKYLSWIHSLCYPNINLSTRIFGGGWSTPSFLGRASEDTIRKSYSSATICPNLFEPHAIEVYSDLNQRLFQIPACGGFQLCQRAIGVEEVFAEDEIALFDDQKDFVQSVLHYYEHPEDRVPFIKKSMERVYREHTNFHRAAEVFDLLGLPKHRDEALARVLVEVPKGNKL